MVFGDGRIRALVTEVYEMVKWMMGRNGADMWTEEASG